MFFGRMHTQTEIDKAMGEVGKLLKLVYASDIEKIVDRPLPFWSRIAKERAR